jgi:hypothetical protein
MKTRISPWIMSDNKLKSITSECKNQPNPQFASECLLVDLAKDSWQIQANPPTKSNKLKNEIPKRGKTKPGKHNWDLLL